MMPSSEYAEQCALFEWARLMSAGYPELSLLFAVPNGAKLHFVGHGKHRFAPEAIRLKKQGLLPGVSDIMLPVPKQNYHGAFIEMKYGRNKMTSEQVWFSQAIMMQGYYFECCYSADEAIAAIKNYLGIK